MDKILQSSKIVCAKFSFVPKISEVSVKIQFTQGHNDLSFHKLHCNFKGRKIIQALLLAVLAVITRHCGGWSFRRQIIKISKRVFTGSVRQAEFIAQRVEWRIMWRPKENHQLTGLNLILAAWII